MKYYMHDTNSFQDEKITELFIAHGYEGLGLFYTLLEKFALQEKPIKTAVLKRQLSVGKKLEKCWNFMESLELIYSNNGETFNENILKFTEKFQKDQQKTKERVKQWRDKQRVTENVTDNEHVRNTPNYTILNSTKLNYTDDEESSEKNPSTTPVFLLPTLVNFSTAKDLLRFDSQYGEHAERQTSKTAHQLEIFRIKFFDECQALSKLSWKDEKDLKSHFVNWVNKQPSAPAGGVYTGPQKTVVDHSKPSHNAR